MKISLRHLGFFSRQNLFLPVAFSLSSSPKAPHKSLLLSRAIQLCLYIVNITQEDKSQVVINQNSFCRDVPTCMYANVCMVVCMLGDSHFIWNRLHYLLCSLTMLRDDLVPFYRRKDNLMICARLYKLSVGEATKEDRLNPVLRM